MKYLDSMPYLPKLRVLSLSYNQLNNETQALEALSEKCPALEHLNLMKNPCNPVFSNETLYKQFRAKFSIWIPTLRTLDGTDFADDKDTIRKMKTAEEAKKNKLQGKPGLAPIPEEGRSKPSGSAPMDKSIKAQSGTTNF